MCGLGGADEVDCVFIFFLPPIHSLAFTSVPNNVTLSLFRDREVDVCLRGPDEWWLEFRWGGWSDLYDSGHETPV